MKKKKNVRHDERKKLKCSQHCTFILPHKYGRQTKNKHFKMYKYWVTKTFALYCILAVYYSYIQLFYYINVKGGEFGISPSLRNMRVIILINILYGFPFSCFLVTVDGIFLNLCMVGNWILSHGISLCLGDEKSTRLEDSRLEGHIKKLMPPKMLFPKLMHSM